MRRTWLLHCLVAAVLGLPAVAQDARPYLRQPAISPDGTQVAFVHAGDIYLVSSQGGLARLLISHASEDSRPRFSPDGRTLAFSSERTGGGDVYTLSLQSGELKRLTHHSSSDQVEGWSPDGRWVLFSSSRHDIRGNSDIYQIDARKGGMPIPVSRDPYEEEYNAALSPDGKSLAFNANDGVRQWWRHGPRRDDTTEIWIKTASPDSLDYRRVTSNLGKDSWPMWAPNGKSLLFVSDESGSENIWRQELKGKRKKLTDFDSGRVLWPDIDRSRGRVVFEREMRIWLMEPKGKSRPLEISVIADERRNPVRQRTFNANVSEYHLSPDGKKIAFVVHGEVFATSSKKSPEEDGPEATFRVTRTPAREAGLVWSGDSNHLIYTSDRDGNPDLYAFDFLERKERRLTDSPESERMPAVSPDGRWCAYYRGNEEIRLISLEDWSDRPFIRGFFLDESLTEPTGMAFSPDSAWLVYFDTDGNYFRNLFSKKLEGGQDAIQLTYLPNIEGELPLFSPDGRFVVFSSAQYRYDYEIHRVDLLPIRPKLPEERFDQLFTKPGSEEAQEGPAAMDAAKDGKDEDDKPPEVKIVPQGIKDRIQKLASFANNSRALAITPDSKTIFFTNRAAGRTSLWSASADPQGEGEARQRHVSSGTASGLRFSPDKKTLWFVESGAIRKMPVKQGKAERFATRAEMETDFHQEKLQVFAESWRLLRDHFYDETFNGLEWASHYARYQPYVRGARTDRDLARILNLMVGDLNASHLGAFMPGEGAPATGDLGITFDPVEYLSKGLFKIEDVVPAGPAQASAPELKAGHYLLSIDGRRLDSAVNLHSLLERKRGKRVVLGYGDRPDSAEKTVSIQPSTSGRVNAARYRRWVRENAEYVERISGNRLGYVHIPDMGAGSLDRFKLDLDNQVHGREGVVIDVRYNSGGFVAPFILDVLQRRSTMKQSFRGRPASSSANLAGNRILDRPTILLQNEQSLSNAEMFAEGYRQLGLGKIVGTRSCGWVIWTWGRPLLNGSFLRLPRMAVTTIEGEDLDDVSREPDIFVDRPVGQGLTGQDDQLDTAVRELLKQIDDAR